MFPGGARFTQGIKQAIEISPEGKDDEVLRVAESRPTRENTGAGIDQLVMSFYGNTYKSGIFFMR